MKQKSPLGFEPTEYDHPCDWVCENGMYHHLCWKCDHEFIGHKYRRFCKICWETMKHLNDDGTERTFENDTKKNT